MKKKMMWIFTVVTALAVCASAEVLISSPTGTPDESDVVLEAIVDIVRDAPADTFNVLGGTLDFVEDEVRNTTHGLKSAFAPTPAREIARNELFNDVSEAWNLTDEIQMRSYTLSEAVGAELLGSKRGDATTVDVREVFAGIDFPKGTTAFYRPATRRLVVYNRPANLLAVEQVLALFHEAEIDYKQVEINAKFIEVSQSTINQLGFSWRIEDVPGADALRLWDHGHLPDNQDVFSAALRTASAAFGAGVPEAGSMVLTKGGWMPLTVAITALEQDSDSDVLSAPSITTRDGAEAEIWVGEDRMVPEGFDVNSSEVNIHVLHEDWDSQLMGVYFSVTPEILADDVIRLELNPRIVDLLGYDSYQVAPEVTGMDGSDGADSAEIRGGQSGLWNIFPRDPYKGSPAIYGTLPYFRVREIETTVDVADGSTVGLGGLIYDRLETYKDKVPVLGSIPLIGRLFRSEGERSIKRNLMIFVSATQVADNGQRKADLAAAGVGE